MMKIHIKNFQALEDVELEVDGFTVIVGRTNLGKTSTIRAIKGAMKNLPGDSFVREGKTHCEVDIECPEMNLNWKKGGGYNDYEIDGELLQSVGHGAPPHIAENGFRELQLSRDSVSVQVADQFSPIFLLDPSQTSGSSAAEVISDVGRLGEVQTALVQAGKDRREKRSTERVREQDLKDVNEKLMFFDELDSDLETMGDVEKTHKVCNTLRKKVSFFDRLSEKVDERQKDFDFYDGIQSVGIPPAPTEEEDLLDELSMFDDFHTRTKSALRDFKKYKGLEDIELPESEDVSDLSDRYEKINKWVDKRSELLNTIDDSKDNIARIEQELKEAEDHVHQVLVENGTCPVCNRDVE